MGIMKYGSTQAHIRILKSGVNDHRALDVGHTSVTENFHKLVLLIGTTGVIALSVDETLCDIGVSVIHSHQWRLVL